MMKVSRINQLNLMPFTSALGFFSENCVESRGFVLSPFGHDGVIRGLPEVKAGIKICTLSWQAVFNYLFCARKNKMRNT